jgi:hypothetical protein
MIRLRFTAEARDTSDEIATSDKNFMEGKRDKGYEGSKLWGVR